MIKSNIWIEFHWFRWQKWIRIFEQKFKIFDHSVFATVLFWVKTAVVKNESKIKSGFLSISPPILVLQTTCEYPWNPCEISDQMRKRVQKLVCSSKFFFVKRVPQNRVNCRFRRHLLSEMHNFRAIWLVSSRLPEHCQFSLLPGRIGHWRLFPFILPYRFLHIGIDHFNFLRKLKWLIHRLLLVHTACTF